MAQTTALLNQKSVGLGEGLLSLERKAAFFDELLSFIEDKIFGFLMERTEKEENLSAAKARQALKAKKA